MKKIKKIAFWVAVVVLAVFILGNIFLGVFGKKILLGQIKGALNTEASIGRVSLGFPFAIKLSDLVIADFAKLKSISVSPSILGLFAGKIVLSDVTVDEPVITLVQSAGGALNIPQLAQKGDAPEVLVAAFTLKNGSVTFTDKKVGPNPYSVTVDRINLKVAKNTFPLTSLFVRFWLAAKMADSPGKDNGSIQGEGWIDFTPKDMDGNFTLSDIEVAKFSPYYGSFISRKGLQSAKLNLKVGLNAKADALKVACYLKISDFVYGKVGQDAPKRNPLEFMPDALDLFTDEQGNINQDFSFTTSLTHPQFNILKVLTQSAGDKLLSQSPEKTTEGISQAVEKFKAIGKNFKGILNK